MSVRVKVLSLFLGLYIGGIFLITLFSLLSIRSLLHDYLLDYMDYQVRPLLEFYRSYYKNPDYYAPLLTEDVVSGDIASFLLDNKGRVLKRESFLEGEFPNLEEDELKRVLGTKRGVLKDYAYIVKSVGDYKLLLVGKLDRIKEVERRIVLFTVGLVLFILLLSSLLATAYIKRLLSPLNYLTEVSRRISKGEISLEVKRSERKDEFGLLEEAYANMVERLKGIILWQKEFIRNITHALKTPLTYIKGQVELMQAGIYEDRNLEEIYKNINMQVSKMEKLITQLSTLMRLESQMPLKVERIALNQILAELEEEYEFIKKERRFTVEYTEENVELLVDKEYLKTALRNLIENAYKYTDMGGKIRLYYESGCIVVEDEGIGMEHPERAGEMFYREDHGKDGLGLGLSIVKAIASKMNMDMRVHSKRGLGTKVSLCII
jgi:signal transduction histidine kinase